MSSTKLYKEGARVFATKCITEGDVDRGSVSAPFGAPDYIHALSGMLGTVIHTDIRDLPTVRFDDTGTATRVRPDEIAPLRYVVQVPEIHHAYYSFEANSAEEALAQAREDLSKGELLDVEMSHVCKKENFSCDEDAYDLNVRVD